MFVDKVENTLEYKQYRLIHDVFIFLDICDYHLFREFNLTKSQYRVLTLLDAEQGERLITLSDRILCARSTITRIIDQLEEAKLVERVPDPEDRRAQRVILTPEGVKRRSLAYALHERAVKEWLGVLGEAEQEQFLNLLQTLRTALEVKLPKTPIVDNTTF